MKRFLMTTALVMCCICVFANHQNRVVETSGRMPAWVYHTGNGYLSVSAEAATMNEAQDLCLAQIRRQVAESVAVKVMAQTTMHTAVTEDGAKSSRKVESEEEIRTKTANLPYIREISLAKAADTYWEHRYDKKTDVHSYMYAVRYPFSDFDLKKLIMDYESNESRLNSRIEELEAGVDSVASLEDIESALDEIFAIRSEFDDDDPRMTRLDVIANDYRRCYDNVDVQYKQVGLGRIVAVLVYKDKEIATKQTQQLKSKTAEIKGYKWDGDFLVIDFEDRGDAVSGERIIELRFRISGRYITKKLSYK